MHTPRDPFAEGHSALESFEDGGLAFADGRILATGDFARVRREHPEAEVVDGRGALLLPGLVDTHVHWSQLGIVGAMGFELLEWLALRTLPEEARLAEADYARALARDFVRGLAANGTTTALVFGSHFPEAQAATRPSRRSVRSLRWPGRTAWRRCESLARWCSRRPDAGSWHAGFEIPTDSRSVTGWTTASAFATCRT